MAAIEAGDYLGDVRESDVLFQERRQAGPIAVAMTEEELVIGDRENQSRERLLQILADSIH